MGRFSPKVAPQRRESGERLHHPYRIQFVSSTKATGLLESVPEASQAAAIPFGFCNGSDLPMFEFGDLDGAPTLGGADERTEYQLRDGSLAKRIRDDLETGAFLDEQAFSSSCPTRRAPSCRQADAILRPCGAQPREGQERGQADQDDGRRGVSCGNADVR